MPVFSYQSSPPSTPGSTQRPISNFFGQHPSTTPAGPPPSNTKSFTPAGIPSSIAFPSSKQQTQIKPPPSFSFGNGQRNSDYLQTKTTITKVRLNDLQDDNDEDDDEDEDEEEEEMDADGDNDMEPEYPGLGGNGNSFGSSYDWASHGDSTRHDPPHTNNLRDSRLGKAQDPQLSMSLMRMQQSVLPDAARNLARRLGKPALTESDGLILQTETQVNKMYKEDASREEAEAILTAALKIVPEALCKVWQSCCNEVDHTTDEQRGDSIGPFEDDPGVYKATFVGSLLLSLNHPPTRVLQGVLRASTNSRAVAVATAEASPKVLIDWLDQNHNPYRSALPRLHKQQPNATASNNFWDLILSGALRGQVGKVATLLADADFQFAASAKQDGSVSKGYKGSELQMAGLVVGRAAARLKACPALKSGDWHISNNAWSAWRVSLEAEMIELFRLAEVDDDPVDAQRSPPDHFGMSTRASKLSTSVRKAQSKVPWTVYENLRALYQILLGSPENIVSIAQDWLKATLSLAIWWNGTDGADFELPTTSTRQSRTRTVDIDVVQAYRQRLADAFQIVTQEEALQIDANNAVEVAIASVLEGNIQDAFSILRMWSIPITSAIMEIGTEAQWYEAVPSQSDNDMFDESDLMVLSYAQPEKPVSKDSVLVEYATMLLDRAPLDYKMQQVEGWELAVELCGRIDNTRIGIKTAENIIKGIAITDGHRADRVIAICNQFELLKEAAEIAEKYGDSIPDSNPGAFGTALVYYARAHNTKKVKDVLDLLISYCLVQSTSFPSDDKLDAHLSDLLHRPRETLTTLAAEDQEAAEILSAQFSGYATIRKYFDVRDDTEYSSAHQRQKAAAAALLTAIQSAADNIQGGLYDNENPAVIPVDGLLALLGEASVFIDHKPRILTLPHLLTLIRATEDLNSVHPRIKAQCAEFFSSTLAAGHGASQPDPRELMKKSISDLTASSAFSQSTGFSLLGGSIMGSGIGSSYVDVAASGTSNGTDSRKRAWDWRQNCARDTKPGRLVKKLRLALAEEVGSAWIDDEI